MVVAAVEEEEEEEEEMMVAAAAVVVVHRHFRITILMGISVSAGPNSRRTQVGQGASMTLPMSMGMIVLTRQNSRQSWGEEEEEEEERVAVYRPRASRIRRTRRLEIHPILNSLVTSATCPAQGMAW